MMEGGMVLTSIAFFTSFRSNSSCAMQELTRSDPNLAVPKLMPCDRNIEESRLKLRMALITLT